MIDAAHDLLQDAQQTGEPAQGELFALPASFAQRRLWFLDQWAPGSAAYNVPDAFQLRGPLQAGALERALNEIIRRHEILRTTFAFMDGEPVQVIAPEGELSLALEDLSSCEDAMEQALALAREESRRPFDLERGPLLRATLYRLTETEHVLLSASHHIVTDGWSTGVFLHELSELYTAFVAGRPSPLPELPIQYADFALWQQEWLQGEVLEEQLAYWRHQLGGTLPTLHLPIARGEPASRSDKGAIHTEELPLDLARSLTALAQGEDATLFMTMLAGLAALLDRYTGQHDVVVGAPIANRNRAEIEHLIGFFANTLALRLDLSGDPTARELLRRAREVCLGAYAHQDLPFEKLVEALQPERDLGRTPIFQVALTVETDNGELPALDGVTLRPLEVDIGAAKFDLTLDVTQTRDALLASFSYRVDMFDAEAITRMAGHFRMLLAAMVAEPDRPLSLLPLLPEAERLQLLAWGAARASYPPGSLLHERFEAQARSTPYATAVVYEDQRLSYAALNERAEALAERLSALGVGADVLVALCLERGPELIVAILGTLKAGGAYLPLDPAYPAERLGFMIEDSKAPVIITQSHLLDRLPPAAAAVLALDADDDVIEEVRTPTPLVHQPVSPDSLAYVIYTSGSTGRPKGVLITHANVTRLFDATHAWFGFDEHDVWTLFHSYAFDFSVWEIWGALLYGGTLVVVPYLISRSPADFHQLIREQGVTVLNQTPSAFRQFMLADEHAGPDPASLALRLVIFGGEALELQSLRPWFARHGDQTPQLVNMYGITETTVHVTYRPISTADPDAGLGSMIGQPIPDLELYVLDEHWQPLPVGVPGELYVGGAGLARGYLNRPELTNERFIPHPFRPAPGARLYRSGDLARYLRNGDLEYLGRIDQQVKLRGFRIELGEIEAALGRHEGVREAAVLLREDVPAEKRLVAYVVPRGQTAPGDGELRAHLLASLPDYMVPAAFVLMDTLPLTSNGKLDRRALPVPSANRPSLHGQVVAPTTPAQEALAVIWAEVLNLEQVGIRDNFFALGGDSIRSVRVLAMAKERGLPLTLQQLFRHQTIEELSHELSGITGDDRIEHTTQPFSLISPEDRAQLPEDVEDAYPITSLQAGMLYHMEMNPKSTVYHNVDSVHQAGRLDPDAFRAAVQATVARHPALRTSFDFNRYSEPLQLVHRTATAEVRIEDLRHLSTREQEAIIDAAVEEEQRRRFDPATAPLVRFLVHRRTDSRYQFTLTDSHLILDGWSVSLKLAEIFERHFALIDGRPFPEEAPPEASVRDFVQLERLALDSEEQQRYWEEKLSDAAVMRIPRLHPPRPEEAYDPVRTVRVPIAPELADGLQRLARATAVPLKSVLLAAHLRVMSLLAGRADVVTGVVSNGRPEVLGGERVLGLFLNTLPFRLELAGGSWSDLVRAAFAAEQELLPYRRYPLAALQQRQGQQALFEASFNYTNFHAMTGVLRSGDMELLDENTRAASDTNFTLDVDFSIDPAAVQGTALALELSYNAMELDAEQAETIGGYFSAVLRAMTADPAARYETARLLSPAEEQLLAAWSGTELPAVPARLVHKRIADQAARTPDALAVVAGAQSLTYQELDQQAERLAAVLRSWGVGPEVVVGVCLERSLEAIVALLGILKAGGAYLPLDPAYPAERLAYMLADAGARLLLTDAVLAAQLAVPAGLPVLPYDLTTPLPLTPDPAQPAPSGAVGLDTLAYVIYTSGSTGRPKGVMVRHANLANFATWAVETFATAPGDRVLQFASLSFDTSLEEIVSSLTSGATLVLRSEAMLASPREFLDECGALGISVLDLPTAYWREIVRGLNDRSAALPSGVRLVIIGGEAAAARDVAVWHERVGAHVLLLNSYGPTETTIASTAARLTGDGAPIGRPIANTRVYVLDQHRNPVPVGVPGELYIGGAGVARGYLGQPELTAERFVSDPFSSQPGARLYRTGDRVSFLSNGELEYLGRIDQQVKLRGFRIELGEIESALSRHPAVREAAVLLREDVQGEPRLVAYVAGDDGLNGTELRRFLASDLPEYMLPAAFVLLPRLPLTPSGKLDRRALPAPTSERGEDRDALVPPRNALEARLVAVWEEVLGVRPIGVTDSFFELGGHSLLALRLVTRLRETLGRELPLATLLQCPTVERLAAALAERDEPRRAWSPLVPIQPAGSRPPLFMVHPAGGGVLCYAELAGLLGSDQPVYGLQAAGWDDDAVPLTDVEAMAATYAAAIRTVQPHGPYYLGGWSVGGLIALALARRLQERGESIALLALFDTWAPEDEAPPSEDELAALFARDLLGVTAGELPAAGPGTQLTDDQRLTALLAVARDHGGLPADLTLDGIRRLYGVFRANVVATARYRPDAGSEPLLLVRAAESDGADATLGWDAAAYPCLRVASVPGDHYTLLRPPFVRRLADELRKALDLDAPGA